MNHDFKTDINWQILRKTQNRFGNHFFMHFGYFITESPGAIQKIEDAMRANNAAKMVLPANRLAEDAFLFGAIALGELAETVEHKAQECVTKRTTPEILKQDICKLPLLYHTSISRIEREISPLVHRKSRIAFPLARQISARAI